AADALAASKEWRARELKLIARSDEAWYPSEVEVGAVKAIDPALRVRAIPAYLFDGSDPAPYDAASRRDVMFVGGFAHDPNVDAARWLHDEIWPLVKDRTGDMRVFVIGSKPPQEVLDMNEGRFVVTGPVSDEELDRYYHTCRMAVVPLRYGAGIKGKVVEAMYHRLPVLTTTTGAEGIPCGAEALPTADDAAGFAESLARLYADEAALNAMSARYERFIEETYSEKRAAETLSPEFDGWR
ncbi:MAG: glycosyltransferase, partial [Clostridia bacterium]|nr:glycosyltransferase [Clostridia bacterium]